MCFVLTMFLTYLTGYMGSSLVKGADDLKNFSCKPVCTPRWVAHQVSCLKVWGSSPGLGKL